MKREDVKIGLEIKGWRVLELKLGYKGNQVLCEHIKCGHHRKWNIFDLTSAKFLKCAKCARAQARKDKIGMEFGTLTITAMRPGKEKNAFAVCKCGSGKWRTFSELKYIKSCGCLTDLSKPRKKVTITLKEIKKQLSYNKTTGVLKRKKNGKGIIGELVKINGRQYSTQRICWWIATGKMPEFRVTGNGLKFKDLTCCHHKDRKVQENTTKASAVPQPQTESNMMRTSGKCRKDGLCIHYRSCGDNMFKGKCRGYKPAKREIRQNLYGSALAAAI